MSAPKMTGAHRRILLETADDLQIAPPSIRDAPAAIRARKLFREIAAFVAQEIAVPGGNGEDAARLDWLQSRVRDAANGAEGTPHGSGVVTVEVGDEDYRFEFYNAPPIDSPTADIRDAIDSARQSSPSPTSDSGPLRVLNDLRDVPASETTE